MTTRDIKESTVLYLTRSFVLTNFQFSFSVSRSHSIQRFNTVAFCSTLSIDKIIREDWLLQNNIPLNCTIPRDHCYVPRENKNNNRDDNHNNLINSLSLTTM